MPSARDKCFEAAVDKLQEKRGDKTQIDHQQRWIKKPDGLWETTNEAWYKVVGAISRAKKSILKGLGWPEGAPEATRIPDMTITTPDGKKVVIDNKFDGDSFNDEQKRDYNQINEENNGDPKAKDLKLDRKTPSNPDGSCDCPENTDELQEYQYEVMPFSVVPGVVGEPFPAGAPAGGTVPGAAPGGAVEPGGFGMPEFAF